ncbi:MT-A70 family methyltransferase [Dongia sp.]|uniref:MT-A70 family methyltransferase n=1 Tax=Dongia sp. TaxID=1977262 RepID=UPI00375250D0
MTEKYQVIYADPPWEYRQSGSATSSRGMAKQHYPTMTTEAICRLPVAQLKTDDAVCFMWATFPNIAEALKVLQAWGFEYKTAAFVWVKTNPRSGSPFWGMGAYTRANAEVCLLGISPNTKAKTQVQSKAVHQIIHSPIERHSKKPDEVRRRIEQLLGDVPRLELFAREKAKGWDAWGNEVQNDLQLVA